MANTTWTIVTKLRKRNKTFGALVIPAEYKDNVPGDSDYIAPAFNQATCPIDVALACPVARMDNLFNGVRFEFSLPSAMFRRPGLNKVRAMIFQGIVLVQTFDFVTPTINYFTGTVLSPGAGTFKLVVEYLDSIPSTIHSCDNVATVTVPGTPIAYPTEYNVFVDNRNSDFSISSIGVNFAITSGVTPITTGMSAVGHHGNFSTAITVTITGTGTPSELQLRKGKTSVPIVLPVAAAGVFNFPAMAVTSDDRIYITLLKS